MDANTTPPTDEPILRQVGELVFWTLVSSVLATLSLIYAAGWITSSSAQAIYLMTTIWVPLTVVRFLRLRSRLLGGSNSVWLADVAEGLVGVVGLGAMVVLLAALYGAAAVDVLGIRSPVIWVGAGSAAVVLAFATAVWAKRRGWWLVEERDAPGTTITMGFLVLGFPMMLGMFGWIGATTALMLVERFAKNSEPLRRFLFSNMLAGIVLSATGVLILAGALHSIRKWRARPLHEPNYLQSLWAVRFAIIFLHLSAMLLIVISGGMPL